MNKPGLTAVYSTPCTKFSYPHLLHQQQLTQLKHLPGKSHQRDFPWSTLTASVFIPYPLLSPIPIFVWGWLFPPSTLKNKASSHFLQASLYTVFSHVCLYVGSQTGFFVDLLWFQKESCNDRRWCCSHLMIKVRTCRKTLNMYQIQHIGLVNYTRFKSSISGW